MVYNINFSETPRKPFVSFRRVGGIRFLAIGRIRVSFCVAGR